MSLSYLRKHYKIIVTILVTIVAILCRQYMSYFSLIEDEKVNESIQIFSKDQLRKFNGLDDKNLYLAVLGTIFDVTQKAELYGKGAPYHYFVETETKHLKQILDTCTSDEEQDTSYIPIEEVMEFKSRRNITEKRQELRQNLRQKFAQLCVSTPHLVPQKQDKGCV